MMRRTFLTSGSVQVNIAKRNVIEQIPLMLPKIEIQRKIVEILNSIDNKIEENEDIRIFVDGGHGVHDMFLPG